MLQLLQSGDVMPVEKYPEIIAGISTADVQVGWLTSQNNINVDGNVFSFSQAAAKKLAGSKLAMGATGNLATVPHLDTL